MNYRTGQLVGIAAALSMQVSAVSAQGGLRVSVELPADESWVLLEEKVVGQSYSREWIPAGETYEDAHWLIAQQKVPVDRKVDAMEFLLDINEQTEDACTTTEHEDPDRVRINGQKGVVGRTMCAQKLGESFGTFTDRIIIVEGGYAYVITSELRSPAMVVAGVLSFGKDAPPNAAAQFMARAELSRDVVRKRVTIE